MRSGTYAGPTLFMKGGSQLKHDILHTEVGEAHGLRMIAGHCGGRAAQHPQKKACIHHLSG